MPKEKNKVINSLEKELKEHWEETKEEREKTHCSKLSHKKSEKEVKDNGDD